MSATGTRSVALLPIVIVWAALALLLGALGVFSAHPERPPLELLLAVGVPPLLFGLAYRSSAAFRAKVLRLDLGLLTALQGWRVIGGMFLVLLFLGVLPGVFAWPAGVGDVLVGVYAPFVAVRVMRRAPGWERHVTLLSVLGLIDFVGAIGGGVLSGQSPAGLLRGPVTADIMTELPLSFIPTFGVPFWTILHIISLLRARRPVATVAGAVASRRGAGPGWRRPPYRRA